MIAVLPSKTRGAGGESLPAPAKRSDIRLVEQAVRRRWEIPELAYKAIPLEMTAIVTARDEHKRHIYPEKTRVAAARCLALLHAQNQAETLAAPPAPQEHVHRHYHTLEDRRAAYLARLDQPGDGEGS